MEELTQGLRDGDSGWGSLPPHMMDLEKGCRKPSGEPLVKIAEAHEMDEATVRAAWGRPEAVVGELASQDVTTAQKVPEFLRTARNLSPEQWDELIAQAKGMSSKGKRR